MSTKLYIHFSSKNFTIVNEYANESCKILFFRVIEKQNICRYPLHLTFAIPSHTNYLNKV